jgi:hypothetical protein
MLSELSKKGGVMDKDKKQFIKDMTEFMNLHDKVDANTDALVSVGFDLFSSPIIDSITDLFTMIRYHICERYGIELDAMDWFIFEDDWGAKGYDCQRNDKKMKIKSISDFWKFEKG